MGDVIDRLSADACFKRLEPALKEMGKLVYTAPLSDRDRVKLAANVAGYGIGIFAGVLGLDPKLHTEQVAAQLLEIMCGGGANYKSDAGPSTR